MYEFMVQLKSKMVKSKRLFEIVSTLCSFVSVIQTQYIVLCRKHDIFWKYAQKYPQFNKKLSFVTKLKNVSDNTIFLSQKTTLCNMFVTM